MEKKLKKIEGAHPALIIAVALTLILSIVTNIRVSTLHRTKAEESIVAEDISYSVYVGLTDKNQNRQIIDDEVALELIKTICINHGVGYTIYAAQGGYNDKGVLHTEKTYVLEMDRIDEKILDNVINDIKKRLNVHTLMIMKKSVEVLDR